MVESIQDAFQETPVKNHTLHVREDVGVYGHALFIITGLTPAPAEPEVKPHPRP